LLLLALESLKDEEESALKLLLRAKANPELPSEDEIYPLDAALERPNFVDILLEWKCDPNRQLREDGATALHLSITRDLPETREVLLRHGANPNALTKNTERSPLFYCTKPSQAISLMDAKADTFQWDSKGLLPAHYFVFKGERTAGCLYAICKNNDCNVPNGKGYSPLCIASSLGDELCVNMLLDLGHDGCHKVLSVTALQNGHFRLACKLSLAHIHNLSRVNRAGFLIFLFLLLFGMYFGIWFLYQGGGAEMHYSTTYIAAIEVIFFFVIAFIVIL